MSLNLLQYYYYESLQHFFISSISTHQYNSTLSVSYIVCEVKSEKYKETSGIYTHLCETYWIAFGWSKRL